MSSTPPKYVLAILGQSYCGSTLLNMMLDCHPDIQGCGELHYLPLRNNVSFEVACTHCGPHCSLWNHDVFDAFQSGNGYRGVFSKTSARAIVDTSKDLSWFKEQESCCGRDIVMCYVLLVKSPIRHVASCVANQHKSPFPVKDSEISSVLAELHMQYQRLYKKMTQDWLVLIYEDLATNPRTTLQPVLEKVGLYYHENMDDVFGFAHHQIGGNGGTVYQAENRWVFGGPPTLDVRRNQYVKKEVFLDDKHRILFSPDQMNLIINHLRSCEFFSSLGLTDRYLDESYT